MTRHKILIVGAGAVGQVYGCYLKKAGADVHFLVKPHYIESASNGFTLYNLARKEEGRSSFLVGKVLSNMPEVAKIKWDQVWLCMSSTALKGVWLDDLFANIGQSIVVTLQPGLDDRAYLLERCPEPRLVSGLIAFYSFQHEGGVAYFFPPLISSLFSGSSHPVNSIVAMLKSSGLPAKVARDANQATAHGAAVLTPLIAALQASGWRFDDFLKSSYLPLARRAALQASIAVNASIWHRLAVPLLLNRLALNAIIRLARRTLAFDLEAFLKYHFTKVGDQNREMMGSYIALAEKRVAKSDALERLLL